MLTVFNFAGAKKTNTVICPDPWKAGARNTAEYGFYFCGFIFADVKFKEWRSKAE